MHLRELILSLGLFGITCSAFGQQVDLKNDRVAMTELAGPWRFHAGDNPAWANPGFDDSGWSLLSANKGWSEQGFEGVPEARNPAGELLGSEKTAAISTKCAEDIAEVAQEFGQEDDVTVVKLTWQPILISPSAALMFSGEPSTF